MKALVLALFAACLVLAVAACGGGGAQSAGPVATVPPASTRVGFVGLPPEGATPGTPESGELVLYFFGGGPEGSHGKRRVRVYADGRLIWLQDADYPEGANQVSTGLLEQRLTPEGVELLRSEIISKGVFGDDQPPLGSKPLPFWMEIQVRNGDRLVRVERASDLERLAERLADPASWLPASAWDDREIRAYVPSRYAVCYEGYEGESEQPIEPSRILTLLPAPAEDLLRARDRTRVKGLRGWAGDLHVSYQYCSDVTIEEARALAEALDDPGLERVERAYWLAFEARGQIGETVHITFGPILPDGASECPPCG